MQLKQKGGQFIESTVDRKKVDCVIQFIALVALSY